MYKIKVAEEEVSEKELHFTHQQQERSSLEQNQG
jgi:hypothetical protein